MTKKNLVVLLILDGWGYREEKQHNAIAAASTPQWDAWWNHCPHALLHASGPCVGLPEGQMGNSEVGHMHIGAGRVILQDFTRINEAIEKGEFARNPIFIQCILQAKKSGKALHVMGLLSAGGVHSHEDHLFAFLDICAQYSYNQVYIHVFLDGRDVAPQSAQISLKKLEKYLKQTPVAHIASISGRYYAMDRDRRWERIELVYRALTEQTSPYHFATTDEALAAFYQQKIYDEFIPPTLIGNGKAIEDGDLVFFFNFRADRARQLTQALFVEEFDGFERRIKPAIPYFVTMTAYADNLPTQCAFPPIDLSNTLGEIVSKYGLHQLRIAETEKYAHVTFFLNGGLEQPYTQEARVLIPSPKVATYDLQPEMSAPLLTQRLVEAIGEQAYDLIICNYANADMVGHTGDFTAAISAVEYLDNCLQEIGKAVSKVHGHLLITADHGNIECMYQDTIGQPHTAHTYNLVPFLYVGMDEWHLTKTEGSLVDIAPTVLTLLQLPIPKSMTGTSLLAHHED